MRKRMNLRAICSSDHYVASKKAHRQMLQENHDSNSCFFASVLSKYDGIDIKPHYTEVKVFGKWISLSDYPGDITHLQDMEMR